MRRMMSCLTSAAMRYVFLLIWHKVTNHRPLCLVYGVQVIPKEAIEEYKQAYMKEYGEEISDAEALKQATNLLSLFRIIYKPIPDDNKQGH